MIKNPTKRRERKKESSKEEKEEGRTNWRREGRIYK